jgi:hypothetical protein
MAVSANEKLAKELIARYGETMQGPDLFKALGFRTYSGFYKANKNNKLPVKVFSLKGRRGYFALTVAVAQFLQENGCEDSLVPIQPPDQR